MKEPKTPGERAELMRKMELREYATKKISESNSVSLEEYRKIRDLLETHLFERNPSDPINPGIKDHVHSSMSRAQVLKLQADLEAMNHSAHNQQGILTQEALDKIEEAGQLLLKSTIAAKKLAANHAAGMNRTQRPKILVPPGSKLLGLSRKIFPKKFTQEVLESTITDMQFEYIESMDAGAEWHRRWVCVRGYASYALALFCGLSATVGKKLVDAWKAVNLS